MPVVEEYGAQPPIELLRQFQDYSGFYDREKVAAWKTIENAVLMIAAAPPGGGRAEVTKRFSRHFHVVCLPPASNEALKTIFESILNGFLSQKFLPEVQKMTAKIVQCTIEIYDRIAQDLRPTPAKSHYTFNLRDVAKVVQGMMMVKPKHANSEQRFCQLHVHEMMRVFHDRLINDDDRHHFKNLLLEVSNRLFSFGFQAEEVGGIVRAIRELECTTHEDALNARASPSTFHSFPPPHRKDVSWQGSTYVVRLYSQCGRGPDHL